MWRMLVWAPLAFALCVLGLQRPAAADTFSEWAPQPCEQSLIVPPPASGGTVTCRVRDVTTTGSGGFKGNSTCNFKNFSAHSVPSSPAAPTFNFFAVGGFDDSRCFALWFAPDQVLGKTQKFDDLTRKSSGWSEPVKLSDDTTAVQFVSESGRRCVGFQKMGETARGGAGAKTRTEGYYCEPAGGKGPLTNDTMLRDIAYARLR